MNDSPRGTIIDAALAYELHDGKGEQWRVIFKNAINALPVKAGKVYKFLVAMSEQDRNQMKKMIRVLVNE